MSIERDAFIYLEPKSRDDREWFAQCKSCRMFVPQMSRCIIHGSKVKVGEGDSCGFWVDWPTPDGSPNPQVVSDHAAELRKDIPGSVTPKESGFVDDRVQCHRCDFFEEGTCYLYRSLGLDDQVKHNACCNAWTKRDESMKGFAARRNSRT